MPDANLPLRILDIVKNAHHKNKNKGLDTVIDVTTKRGQRSQLMLDQVCADGYVGRSATVTNAKGKRVSQIIGDTVTMQVDAAVIFLSDNSVETIQLIAVNSHPRNIPAITQ